MLRLTSCALASVALLLGACTEGGATLVIVQNQVPEEGCSVSTDLGTFRARGLIDVNSDQGYLFTPAVQSVLNEANSETGTQRIVFVEGAEVSLTLPEGTGVGATTFTQRFSGSIFPQGISTFAFEIVPAEVLASLRGSTSPGDRVVAEAEITLFGTLEGSEIESQPYVYPVEICNGCVATFDLGLCSELPAGYEATGGICVAYQDTDSVECCTDDGGNAICPAVGGGTDGGV